MTRLPLILLALGVAVYCWSYWAGQHRGHIYGDGIVPVRSGELWELNPG